VLAAMNGDGGCDDDGDDMSKHHSKHWSRKKIGCLIEKKRMRRWVEKLLPAAKAAKTVFCIFARFVFGNKTMSTTTVCNILIVKT
jgi:hypothetical protein